MFCLLVAEINMLILLYFTPVLPYFFHEMSQLAERTPPGYIVQKWHSDISHIYSLTLCVKSPKFNPIFDL